MTNAEMAETFTILGRYQDKASVVPEHDEMFIGHETYDLMTEADRARMEALGWEWDEDIPAWNQWISA